jgi:hypothetical protein
LDISSLIIGEIQNFTDGLKLKFENRPLSIFLKKDAKMRLTRDKSVLTREIGG